MSLEQRHFHDELSLPPGHGTTDDSWENRWRVGQNSYLGFDPAFNGTGTGNGAKSLGVELGKSQAFASCQVKKVFRTVCLRDPEDSIDRTAVTDACFVQVDADVVAVHIAWIIGKRGPAEDTSRQGQDKNHHLHIAVPRRKESQIGERSSANEINLMARSY